MNIQLCNSPEKWKLVKLGEVLQSIEAGKSFSAQQRPAKPGEWGVLKISALTWGEFRYQENKALSPEVDISGVPTVHAGDLLISRANTVELVGAVAMAKEEYPNLLLSDKTLRLNPDPTLADSKYLMYVLRTPDVRQHLEGHATGTSGSMRNITQVNIRDTVIPLPPIAEQKRIAAILDKAEELRSLRRKSIEQLGAIVQSIFLEMFGDPVTNPKGNRVVQLSDITNRITDGVHQKPNYTEIGVPFISVKNITTGRLIFDDCKFISREDHERFTKRCRPELQDILYTKVGATYGRPALINTDKEFSIYVSVCLIKPNRSLVDPLFLCAVLGTSAVKNQVDKSIKGIGVPDLHLNQIQNFLIPLPSMSEQQEFTRRIEAIEQLKTTHRESLAQLDALFASLQYRAFRGEL